MMRILFDRKERWEAAAWSEDAGCLTRLSLYQGPKHREESSLVFTGWHYVI